MVPRSETYLPTACFPGSVYLVGAGPGDPGLITLRGVECLQQADLVVHDRLIGPAILAHAPQAELFDVGKQPDHHPIPQPEINALLIRGARAGRVVVRLKGGDPFVFGRGGEEALALAEAGVPFEVVPGVTSAVAVPAYAGIPVTERDLASSVAVITGHRAAGCKVDGQDWRRFARAADTLVFLMGMQSLPNIAAQLIAGGRDPATPVAVIQDGTLPGQTTVTGTLADIGDRAAGLCPPATIVVGDVVRLREALRWYDRGPCRPLQGLRVLNTETAAEAADLSSRLAAAGAQPVELPTLCLQPLDDCRDLDQHIERLAAARSRSAYGWLIFATAPAVRSFMERLLGLGRDVRDLSGLRLGAYREPAAQALQAYGLRPDCVARRGPADFNAAFRESNTWQVLLIQPAGGQSALRGELLAIGAAVETVAAYALAPAVGDRHLSTLQERLVDVVAFCSAPGLNSLAAPLGRHRLADVLAPLKVACAGRATVDAAHQLGVAVDVYSADETACGLVEALAAWRARS